jgi:GntR family transcriptional regulator of gluconate operon
MNTMPELDMPKRMQLWEHVLDSLRTAIVAGDLPPGTHLVETELVDRLQASRWPIRQALTRLEQEGLVVTYPNRGAYVIGVTSDDVRDIYDLRRMLECRAARAATAGVQASHMERLRALVQDMATFASRTDLTRFAEADMAFHRLLLDVAGSKRLKEMWELLCAPAETLLILTARVLPDLAHGGPNRHFAILDALESKNPDAVERAMDEHLTAACERALNALAMRATGSAIMAGDGQSPIPAQADTQPVAGS